MSVFACLDQPSPPPGELLLGDGLFNIAGAMIFGCIALVTLFAPLIRRAYRNHVVRLMGLDKVQPRPSSWWKQHADQVADAPGEDAATGSPTEVQKQAQASENRLALATAAAWLTFTAVAWPMSYWLLAEPSALGQLELLAGAGLAAMVPLYANLPPRWKQKVFWACVVVVIITLAGLEFANHLWEEPSAFAGEEGSALWEDTSAIAGEEESSLWEDLFAALIVFGVIYILFHRRLRGLVFPVSAVLTTAVLAMVIPLALAEPHLGSCLSGLEVASEADAAAAQFWSGGFVFAFALFFFLGIWAGFRVIGALARLIEKGVIGDLSMISLIGLALAAIFIVFWVIGDTAESYRMSVTWAPLVWLLAPVAAYRVVLTRRVDSGPGRDLLVLRVFSRDKKKQVFLDELQSRWRFIGAVNLAGGPDMVDLNVDTYECAKFLSSRLHELFLPEALDARHLASRFNNEPDQEGRYRINEMFNFNTAWRQNVEQLILLSKTILLDVRGLTAEREGTSYEIGLLARHGLLSRVIAVGDEETDWRHIDQQLKRDGLGVEQLKRTESSRDLDGLVSELLRISSR